MPVNDDYDVLEQVVRSSYAATVWSHKIQEKQADIYAERFRKMETANIAAASLTSVGIVALIFTDPLWLKLVSAMISFATVYITAYFKSFDLQKLIVSHKATANRLVVVRDQYKVLLTKIRLKDGTIQELLIEFNELVNAANTVYQEAPATTDKAVDRASKALKINEDNTFSDTEIDMFLPTSLRRSTNE